MTVEAMKAGAVQFLTKPFTDQTLLGAIRHAIERSRETLCREKEMQSLRDDFASLSLREQEVMALVWLPECSTNKWPSTCESAKLQFWGWDEADRHERFKPLPPNQRGDTSFSVIWRWTIHCPSSNASNCGGVIMIGSSDFRTKRIPLNSGTGRMPVLGFGTLIPDAAVTISATRDALEAGFRHFDCAERYRNEREVGEALQAGLAAGGIAREEIFVTTKLWNTNHRPERVEPAFEASLARLGLSYLDLYLSHTPFAFQPGDEQDPRDQNGNIIYDHGVTLLETWRAMETLVDHGKCRAIGLSDITLDVLLPIYESARIKPAVVQVEAHPYLPETELLEFCKQKGIVFLAFAPLGHGLKPGPLEDPVVSAIAAQVGKTPAQVLLAWAVQRGTALLTTPRTAARARENFNIAALPEEALDEINRIQTRQRFNAVVNTGSPGFIPQGR